MSGVVVTPYLAALARLLREQRQEQMAMEVKHYREMVALAEANGSTYGFPPPTWMKEEA